jgi:hypothetical protein
MFPAPEYDIGAPAGAQCNNTALVYCASHEWAVLNYLNYTYDPHNMWTWRTDYMNDTTGQRTGFKGSFAEFDLSYTHWIGDVIELRPEARYERQLTAPNAAATGFAYDNPAGGGGRRNVHVPQRRPHLYFRQEWRKARAGDDRDGRDFPLLSGQATGESLTSPSARTSGFMVNPCTKSVSRTTP